MGRLASVVDVANAVSFLVSDKPMIYTVTLNPALDRTLTVPSLRLGEVNRARAVRLDLSGKGINVSRALRLLGVPSRTIAFLGGGTGRGIRDGLAAEGLDVLCVEVADETRQNITVVDEAAGVLTKINEPGAAVSPADLAAMAALIERSAAAGDLWAFTGSLPPGAPSDFYARLITLVQARGGRTFLDSSGEALRQGLAARPYAIKPNSEEAGEALGRPVVSDDDHVAALRWFQDNGSRLVCLTRGARRDDLGVRWRPAISHAAAGRRGQPNRRGGCNVGRAGVGGDGRLRSGRDGATGGGLRHGGSYAGGHRRRRACVGGDALERGQGRSHLTITMSGYCSLPRFCV